MEEKLYGLGQVRTRRDEKANLVIRRDGKSKVALALSLPLRMILHKEVFEFPKDKALMK